MKKKYWLVVTFALLACGLGSAVVFKKGQFAETLNQHFPTLIQYVESTESYLKFRDRLVQDDLRIEMSLLSNVPLFQKNGRVEMVGLNFRQRMEGPISVKYSELHIHAEDSWLMWEPDYNVLSAKDLLLILRLEEEINFGSIEVRLVGDESMASHGIKFGADKASDNPNGLLPLYPDDHKKVLDAKDPEKIGDEFDEFILKNGWLWWLEGLFKAVGSDAANLLDEKVFSEKKEDWKRHAETTVLLPKDRFSKIGKRVYVVPLNEVFSDIHTNRKGSYRWFIRIRGMSNEILQIKQLALTENKLSKSMIGLDGNPEELSVYGTVDRNLPPGTPVKLILENGRKMTSALSFDNKFVFSNIPKKMPFSIRLNYKNKDYYTDHGRWLSLRTDHKELLVQIRPRFKNLIGKKVTSNGKFVTPREGPSMVSALYESHAQIKWPGPIGAIQEYDSHTFTNNYGFIDRDRFSDNPDNCFRILHLGSSHAVALQVPIFQKYNIIMEGELGVRLGKCVEVISSGRDNGDLASNFPILRDYGKKMQPDVALFENSSTLIMQMQPKLLALGFGWDAENNALAGFLFDNSGELVFKENVPDYGLYTVKPTWPELVVGVPFFRSLYLKKSELPDLAEQALQKMGKVVLKMQEIIPDIPIYLHNGLDQAQCRTNCESNRMISPDEVGMDISIGNFLKNHARVCKQFKLSCISIPSTDEHTMSDRLLTFKFDGHYSPRGHQWLAKNLTEYFASNDIKKVSQ